MVETDVLAHLIRVLQVQDPNERRMYSMDRVEHLAWPTVNGRGNMGRPTVSGMGGHLLQSTFNAITTLAKFGGLL